MAALETIAEHRCFGGVQGVYQHASREIGLPMKLSVFRPPQAERGPVPVLFYLAGLTCTEETFMHKAGAQRLAAELGIMLVAPDTSPRGAGCPGEDDDWDFGTGAGFYLDATREPWAKHYRMYSYVTKELCELATTELPGRAERLGIFGHSMGGHGALVCALKNPAQYRSVSAFAPVSAPIQCPWGEKAFSNYLGDDRAEWEAWDASVLVQNAELDASFLATPILIDQGTDDKFLDSQLYPDVFGQACRRRGQALTLRRQAGYDHGYFFIATFVENHLRHHAEHLTG